MGKKGKKKPSQGDQPAGPPKSEAPAAGTSGAAGAGQGDQPEAGGRKGKKQSQGTQPGDTDRGQAAGSSGTGQGPSQGQGNRRHAQETASQQGGRRGSQQQQQPAAQGQSQYAQPHGGGPRQQSQGRGQSQPPQQGGRGQGRRGPQEQQQQGHQQQRPGTGRGQYQQQQQGVPGQPGWSQPQPQRGPGPQQQPLRGFGPQQQQPQWGPGPQQQPQWGPGSQPQPPQQAQAPQQGGQVWGQPQQQMPGFAAPQQPGQPMGPAATGPPRFVAQPPGQMPQAARAPAPQQMQRPPVRQEQPGQQRQPQKSAPQKQARPSSQASSSSRSESLASDMSKLQIKRQDAGDANIVSKVKFKPGTQGRIIKVESNHLQLNLGKIETAYHYDVNIVPDKPKKFLRRAMEAFRRAHFPRRWPAFDGMKNLYTSRPLDDNLDSFFEGTVTVDDEGREKEYKVEIKFANKVDMTPLRDFLNSPVTPQEALQVVDIVLRMAPVQTCLPVGRSFFIKPTNLIDLGEGMEMYHGFYQSAVRGWKPLLNVDVAHKAFPQNINVVDALAQLLSTFRQAFTRNDLNRRLESYQEEKLLKFIKTLRITYEIPGHPGSRKSYRVNGLGGAPSRTTFVNEGQTMTILDYFRFKKNCPLRHPDLPTLWVGNPNREDKILLPLELCVIVEGQAVNRKMTENQTSKMIKHAATDTSTRKNKIMQGVQRANYNENSSVNEFGFSVGNEFQKLDARVLTPPDLLYKNKTARVTKGVWRNEIFLNPVTINRWTICSVSRFPPRPDECKRMADLFEQCGRNVGMNFANRATEPFEQIKGRQMYTDVEQFLSARKGKFDIIFVIVPDSGPEYAHVKKAAEISVGCLTQCIKSGTVARKMNQQTAVNILLKVNSKLTGTNHCFAPQTKPNIFRSPIMIMGADVTHPSPDARDIPSVAAVTASHDPKAFQYNICWRLQNPKAEIIEDLEAIVMEHLRFFKEKTGHDPLAILFFRDGVSEGQFDIVKRDEIRAIERACKKMQIQLKITFVVVQKRHHTRLFPLNPRDSEDRNCNVPAGTCVDTEITHPFMQDFYLVSHASIQGVAKPTKYCTLYDQNNMSNDDIQQIAYYLCHMFTRCNRSVSYPAPTYYAHLAAARAKVYIENDRLNLAELQHEFTRYQIKDEIRKGLPMFFV